MTSRRLLLGAAVAVANVTCGVLVVTLLELRSRGWAGWSVVVAGAGAAAATLLLVALWQRRALAVASLAASVCAGAAVGVGLEDLGRGGLAGWEYAPAALVTVALAAAAVVIVAVLVPAPWILAGGLALVLSPLSRDGAQARSTAAVLLLVATLALGVLLAGEWRATWGALPRAVRRIGAALLALLLVSATIGALAGHELRLIAWDLEPFLEFGALAFLGLAVLREARHRRLLVAALIAIGGAKAGYDLAVFVRHFTPRLRAAGLDGFLADRVLDPGPMLILPLAALWMLRSGRPSWREWWTVASIALIAPLLVISFTRSYWIGFALAMLLAVAIERGAVLRRAAVLAAVVGVAVVAGAVIAPNGPVGRAVHLVEQRIAFTSRQISDPRKGIERRRQDEARDAIRAAADSRLLGAQAGALVPIAFARKTSETEDIAGFHNYFLQLLFKFGAPGLALFLALVAACVAAMWSASARARGPDRVVAVGALAIWLMEAVQLFLNPLTVSFHVAALMAVLFAGALPAGARDPARAPGSGRRSRSALPAAR